MATKKFIGCSLAAILSVFLGLYGIVVLYVDSQSRAILLRCTSVLMTDAVVTLFSLYGWKRIKGFIHFVGHTHSSHSATIKTAKVIYSIFVFLCLLSWLTPYISLLRNDPEPHWLAYLTFLCLGCLLQFLIGLVVADFIGWIVNRMRGLSSITHTQRAYQFLVAATYAMVCIMYGLHNTSLPPEIRKVDIAISGLPASMDGYRIAQMNDIHLGPTVGRKRLEQVVNIVNTLHADSAVLVGDLVDGPVSRLGKTADVLSEIKVRDGKYYVSGNHEYYTGDVDSWFQFLGEQGFTVLHNSHVKIQAKSGEFFYLAGVDDLIALRFMFEGHGFDLDKAVKSCDPDVPIVLLAHQPKAAKYALDSKYNVKLVLSGHTHGGQMFPFTLVIHLFVPFNMGLYQYKHGHVYVSPGTLYWGIPFRIGTAMEITEITLRAA